MIWHYIKRTWHILFHANKHYRFEFVSLVRQDENFFKATYKVTCEKCNIQYTQSFYMLNEEYWGKYEIGRNYDQTLMEARRYTYKELIGE